MNTLLIAIASLAIVILNVIKICSDSRVIEDGENENKADGRTDNKANEKENKKRLKLTPIISISLAIITMIVSLLNVNVKNPTVLPLNGMLTEEHPSIEIDNDFLVSSYYSDNPHVTPLKGGTKYQGAFVPENSGTYYIQSKFLWNCSDIIEYPFTTNLDSMDKLGVQEGELGIPTPDFSFTSVSDSYITDINNLPDGFRFGWGDNSGGRSGYTIAEINEGKIYDQIVFNSITDGTIGDERNFTATREDRERKEGESCVWNANLINVEIGKTYVIRLYGHNNSPKGEKRTAEDVKVQFQVPQESGRSIAVHGLISSSNAVPSLYWDGVVLSCEAPFHLEFVKARYENNGIGAGGVDLDSRVMNNWVPVGYEQFDGQIPGCYQYSFYALLWVRVVAD